MIFKINACLKFSLATMPLGQMPASFWNLYTQKKFYTHYYFLARISCFFPLLWDYVQSGARNYSHELTAVGLCEFLIEVNLIGLDQVSHELTAVRWCEFLVLFFLLFFVKNIRIAKFKTKKTPMEIH